MVDTITIPTSQSLHNILLGYCFFPLKRSQLVYVSLLSNYLLLLLSLFFSRPNWKITPHYLVIWERIVYVLLFIFCGNYYLFCNWVRYLVANELNLVHAQNLKEFINRINKLGAIYESIHDSLFLFLLVCTSLSFFELVSNIHFTMRIAGIFMDNNTIHSY